MKQRTWCRSSTSQAAGVYSAAEALADDAPLVHDAGNVLVSWRLERGDVEQAFAEADVVVEDEYRTQHVEHAYLETEAGVGWIENDVVTLRVSTQVIEHATEVAEILELPSEPGARHRVVHGRRLRRQGGHDRRALPRAAGVAHPQAGADGVDPAGVDPGEHQAAPVHDALPDRRPRRKVAILAHGGRHRRRRRRLPVPQRSRALRRRSALDRALQGADRSRARSRAVFTNNVPTSAFRGFGAMQVVLGYESQMDAPRDAVGISRTAIRDLNYVEKGDVITSGEPITTAVAVTETREQALAALGPPSPPSGPNKVVGQGFGNSMQPYGRTIWFRDHASAWVTLQPDGTLLIRSGVTDLGAGQAASLCQIAAEILGVPLERHQRLHRRHRPEPAGRRHLRHPAALHVRQRHPPGGQSAARPARSRRCHAARRRGRGRSNGRTARSARRSRPGGGHPRRRRAGCAGRRESTPRCCYTWRAPAGQFDPDVGQGGTFPDYTFGTHAAEVEVDLETGSVQLTKYAACHDVGRLRSTRCGCGARSRAAPCRASATR